MTLLGREKAAEHAANFMFNREQQANHLAGIMQRPPIIVSPYDAELFGHWWYEGPGSSITCSASPGMTRTLMI
jgi:predicted glycosyl hydrolase (DUF1957 family)